MFFKFNGYIAAEMIDKQMKRKFQIEYPMRNVSLSVLWGYIGNASGLSDWFADEVSVADKIYTFRWNDSEQEAELLNIRAGNYVRFHWLDEDDEKAYFEFKIFINDLTADVALIITDFAEPDEKDDVIELWNKQVNNLRRIAGIIH